MKINQIVNGWGRVILESLDMEDPEIKQMAEKRLEVCKTCPLRSQRNFCSSRKSIEENGEKIKGCGCYLPAAVKVEDKECPRGLWT